MMESARSNLAKAIVFTKRELKAVRAPTLLLIGAREVLYRPNETIALAKSRVPDLRGYVMANADHLAFRSAPGKLNERVLQFMRKKAGQ